MQKGTGDYKYTYKFASYKAKDSDQYFSLIKKMHFLNALSQ